MSSLKVLFAGVLPDESGETPAGEEGGSGPDLMMKRNRRKSFDGSSELDGVDFNQLDDAVKAIKRMAMYEAKYGEDSHTSTSGEMDAVTFGDWVTLEHMENPNTSGMLTGELVMLSFKKGVSCIVLPVHFDAFLFSTNGEPNHCVVRM